MQITQTDFIPGTKIQHSINVLITVPDSSGMVKNSTKQLPYFVMLNGHMILKSGSSQNCWQH